MIPVSIPEGFDITDVEEIPLCETLPSLHENIHLFSPEYCRITSGNIIGTTSDIAFQCNPCISEDSEFGAPLLNNSFELIGMSTGYGRLYLTAISSISIARAIERTQGRQFQVMHCLMSSIQYFAVSHKVPHFILSDDRESSMPCNIYEATGSRVAYAFTARWMTREYLAD
uniref:Uncharacterized protein n=1 Tax=Oryza rufipogon TaxID=4529 RepID=A0A0E0P3V4_ORYRU